MESKRRVRERLGSGNILCSCPNPWLNHRRATARSEIHCAGRAGEGRALPPRGVAPGRAAVRPPRRGRRTSRGTRRRSSAGGTCAAPARCARAVASRRPRTGALASVRPRCPPAVPSAVPSIPRSNARFREDQQASIDFAYAPGSGPVCGTATASPSFLNSVGVMSGQSTGRKTAVSWLAAVRPATTPKIGA